MIVSESSDLKAIEYECKQCSAPLDLPAVRSACRFYEEYK